MNCAIHPQTPAAAYCRTCGKALCESCKRDVRGIIYCEDCIASRVEGQPGAAAASMPGVMVNPNAPNPVIATLLGFIPGVGAMYCGEFTKAIVHIGILFLAIAAASTHFPVIGGLFISFWYFYMILDSYQTARAKQFGQPVPDLFGLTATASSWVATRTAAPSPSTAAGMQPAASTPAPGSPATPTSASSTQARACRGRQGLPVGAIILIIIGALFLLDNVAHIEGLGKFWPLILIAFGVYKFWQCQHLWVCNCPRCTARHIMAPAILVALGAMGLLDEFTRFGWDQNWPLIIITIGLVKFFQISGPMEGHVEPPADVSPPAVNTASASQQQSEEAPHV